jgi:Protein of unknown function (DUF3386)
MRRFAISVLAVALLAVPARAHFIFILPDKLGDDRTTGQLVFSDSLKPDDPQLLAKVAMTELFIRDNRGGTEPLKFTQDKERFHFSVEGKGPFVVGGECRYGISDKGGTGPGLLVYHPKAYLGVVGKDAPEVFFRPWERQTLEIVPADREGQFQVLWRGKGLPEAVVTVVGSGDDKDAEVKADKTGFFKVEVPKNGPLGLRVKYVEPKGGEIDGKKYDEVRHWATLVVQLGEAKRGEAPAKAEQPDAEATKLLAEARAARANWKDFPGFTADVEVNFDGRVAKGTVEVAPSNKVTLKLDAKDEEFSEWTRGMLRSLVGHRTDNSAALQTPCAFGDQDTTHPLGRLVHVLTDELHSSYRIRDRQILEVNRQGKDDRFTITVLENVTNEEKQYLPAVYTVSTWDVKTGALKSSATHRETWQRVGKFDLPVTLGVVTASADKQEVRTVRLSNHKLAP